jgi:hypothetical protein
MQPLVWDKYPEPVRVVLSGSLAVIAIALFFAHSWIGASAFMLIAALAFNTQYRLQIDPAARTCDQRTLIKPFGAGKTVSFDEVKHIQLSFVSGETPYYRAA